MKFDGATIAEATGGVLHGQDPGAGPIETDSRKDLAGAWFLALVGDRFDGHRFAAAAAEAGALGGVFCRKPDGWDGPWVAVDDTTAALQALGAAARRRLAGPVVGIAGCSGKTTTRELVAAALAPGGVVHRTRANDNNHLGVPLTMLATPADSWATVVELGSSGPGEMAPLVRITDPDVRVCLNIGPAHLEALGDLAAVRAEEGHAVDTTGADQVAVVSADDPWLADVAPAGRVLWFGRAERADVRVVEASVDVDGWCTKVRFSTPQGPLDATLPAPGAHLADDAAAALAVAHAVGVPLVEAAAGLAAYRPVGGRLRRVVLDDGTVVIDDTYNANPMSMAAALSLVAGASGPVAIVLGDMLELGEEEDRYHREVLALAASTPAVSRVVVGERMARAAAGVDGIVAAGDPASAAAVVKAAWPSQGGPGLVLVKGSRGMRLERVVEALASGGVPA